MGYKFYTGDVFTEKMFGGNPLAVFPQASGLTSEQMQKIAREFNLSETVFVLPPETPTGTRRLRIFTPGAELPFAGHPTVGTAYILAALGEISLTGAETKIIFEEGVGLVPVMIRAEDGKAVYSELTPAKLPEYGPPPPLNEKLAAMLSLDVADFFDSDNQQPQAISCGVGFLFIPLVSVEVLKKAKLNLQIWQEILADYFAPHVYMFVYEGGEEEAKVRARMFAPALGIEEDPATGSAATALAGYLAPRNLSQEGTSHWIIAQGVEMGRPSILHLEWDVSQGTITEIRVGGSSVLVSEGVFYLE